MTSLLRATFNAALIFTIATALPAMAVDDGYPSRPIKVIVTNSAGVADDVLARLLGVRLSEVLRQQVVIVNQAGAGGMIAAEMVARSSPDGYTLMITSLPVQVISPQIYARVPYEPRKDFVPIAMFAAMPNVLVSSPAAPFNSLQDVLAYARKNPGKLVMSNAGQGFQSHLANVGFSKLAGIEVLHVPYKGASSLAAVMANEAQLTIAPGPSVIGPIKSGLLRALAVGGTAPSSLFPGVQTIAASGVPGFASVAWTGVVAPNGTPPAVINKLEAAIGKLTSEPSLKEQFNAAGAEPWFLGRQEMGNFIADEYRKYGLAIKLANVKVQ